MHPCIPIEVIGTRQTARQHHHVENAIGKAVECGVGDKDGAARGAHRLCIESGRHDLDAGPSQQINNGDSFEFFAALG